MSQKIWLRAESKKNERRVTVVPDDAVKLIDAGFDVVVEKSTQRCIPVEDYEAIGCQIVEEGAWASAPKDAFILGIKELPKGDSNLQHRHIYFGHVFKNQPGWEHTLGRFVSGQGTLYDLECLVDENQRRVAAFGYWAGYAGAAVAVQAWCHQKLNEGAPLKSVHDYPNTDALITELTGKITQINEKPNMVVIGALGRSGSGAVDLGEKLGLNVSKWDMAETASGGPFPEIQNHSLFVNCILANASCPRFVTADDIKVEGRRLSVICDVSCDPESTYNPIPIYDRTTTFNDPIIRVLDEKLPLDVTAIDHLPSMLPLESSTDYSNQLTPVLLTLDKPTKDVWGRALEQYNKNIARI